MIEPIQIYLDDKAEFISKETNISCETVIEYLLSECDYCDMIGLNDEGRNEPIILEVSDMNEYIAERTNVTMTQADKIAQSEIRYYEKIGAIG